MRKAWAALLVTAAVGVAGCGGGDETTTGGPAAAVLGDGAIKSVSAVATGDAVFHDPRDAAPSPDGGTFYFLATGAAGPAVFQVGGAGGAITTLSEGAALVKPSGIAVATDGSRVYVADDAVRSLPATGTGAGAGVVAGTEGRSARGLDVVRQADGDVVYFTGTDPATKSVGLFRVPAAGGTVTTVAVGSPFVSPDSVVVAGDGAAYVTDQGAGPGQGMVFRVTGGATSAVLDDLHLGAPAGVTLTPGDATLLVSSIDPATRSDQVLFLELATGRTATATSVIGANKDSSGGLHRAFAAPVLAWADVQRPGRVYRVEL